MNAFVRLAIQLLVGLLLQIAHAGVESVGSVDPYLALGIERTASTEEIQARYHELLKKYHPDRAALNGMDAVKATAITQKLNAAYAWLKKNHVRLEMRRPEKPVADKPAPALTRLDVESVLRHAWNSGMNARATLDVMNGLARNNGALALIDQWFESSRAKPDFVLFYLEVARLHPDAGRIQRLGALDLKVLGPMRARAHDILREIARAKPEFALSVNALLYPVTQPNFFQSSETIKAELRALRAMPTMGLRRGLGELAHDSGDGRVSAIGNKLFQDAVTQFMEEEFVRPGASTKPEAFEPFLNLLGDGARSMELRLELLRLPADHAALVDGAIEAARALRAATVVEGNGFQYPQGKVLLHDYQSGLDRLLTALADGDARLSGGRRSEGALHDMLLSLALRAHEAGNVDAKLLIRVLVDAVENKGGAAGADALERLAQGLENRRQTELVFGSLKARQELQNIIYRLRGAARSCRSFF